MMKFIKIYTSIQEEQIILWNSYYFVKTKQDKALYKFNFRKDVRLPVQLQRAMAAEAEAAREARAKVSTITSSVWINI